MQSRWMVEAQYPDLRACALNAQVCDKGGTEKLQGLVLVARKIRTARSVKQAGLRVLIPEGNADFQASNTTRRAMTYHSF
jgi:hypothetical protein